jgi:flavodoxin
MKIAIIYSPQHRKLEAAAKTLGQTLEGKGHRIDYLHISKTDRPPNVRRYDFVCLGSVAEGTFGGKVPVAVSEYIKQCRGFEGTKSATFMMKRFLSLNNRGLRRLMAVLEHMGSMVMDFQLISHKSDAEILGKRLGG